MIPEGVQPGGAPLNVAIHLKKLGLDPILVSRVGNDSEGERLKTFLKSAHLDLSYLQVDAELATSKVMVHLDEQRNATYEICAPVAWDNIQYSDGLEILNDEADLIIYGTLASRSEVTRSTLLRLLERPGTTKLLDVNLRPPYDDQILVEKLLHKSDFVKLNKDELFQIAGWNTRLGSEYELMRWLSAFYDCPAICVTRGAEGAVLFWNNAIIEHPGFKVQTVDTVGAGDAFLAALVAWLGNGASPEKALEYASATGAFVASRSGAVPAYTNNDIDYIIEA